MPNPTASSLLLPAARLAAVAALAVVAGCADKPPLVEPPGSAVAPAAPPPAAPPVPAPRTALPSAAACAALAGHSGMQAAHSQFIADDIAYAHNGAAQPRDGTALPQHCKLAGSLPDAAAGQRGVRFELRLPTRWNGNFFFQGGNGDGVLHGAIGRNSGADGFADNALSRGFAVVSTDGGGSGADGAAADAQWRIDQAYRAHQRSALAARELIEAYYGKPPTRSYVLGCGEGGRQGMMFAQRYPALFDGVVAVAPAMRAAEGAAIAAAWSLQRLQAAAPRGRDRRPALQRAFSAGELFLVAGAVLQRCDALDGAADGLVQDMAACRFDPAELQCSRGRTKNCLSPAKVDALARSMAGPRDRAGRPLYARWPWDPGLAAPGWRVWMLGDGTAEARHATAADSLGLRFATPPDAALNWRNFDFDSDPKRLQAMHRLHDTADDVRLDGFRRNGGKLLLLHGAADPLYSAWDTVDYQQRLNVEHGFQATAQFARTFIVPGMNHCAGGPATDRFDALTAIVDWVEKGQAPQRIEARGSAVLHDETRPLCAWPLVARYRGTGALNESANYACR